MRDLPLHNFNKIFWYFTSSFSIFPRLAHFSIMGNTQIKHCFVKEKLVFRWSSSRDSNLNSLSPISFFGLNIYTSLNATYFVVGKGSPLGTVLEISNCQFPLLPEETRTVSCQQTMCWRADKSSSSQLLTTVFSSFALVLE